MEHFFSGYCRVLDAARTVTAETEAGSLVDCDCCYGSCIHEPSCPIAAAIRGLTETQGE